MSLRHSKHSLKLVDLAYESDGNEGVRPKNIMLRHAQIDMISNIGNYNNMSDAQVVRAIIDEWARLTIRDNQELLSEDAK